MTRAYKYGKVPNNMAIDARDAEKLVRDERTAISNFFGVEVPRPSDRLFGLAETIRQEKLFKDPKILFVPRRSFQEGMTFPGQRVPMSPNLYRYMKEDWIDADANFLPGEWIIFDTTQGADYDGGKQMYADTPRFEEVLVDIHDKHPEILEDNPQVPKDSRFAFAADEIDGNKGFITTEVSKILKLQSGEEVTTPPYSVYYYVGNLDSSLRLGDFTTAEWFRNFFGHGFRLRGGLSRFGGLSVVSRWRSAYHSDRLGFRPQFRGSSFIT